MSYAQKQRAKAKRRAADEADPERRQVRNLIRRGRVPRFSHIGRERIPPSHNFGRVGKLLNVPRLVSSFGLIFEVKRAVEKKG